MPANWWTHGLQSNSYSAVTGRFKGNCHLHRQKQSRTRPYFGNELIDRALSTAIFPELGRMVPEIGEPAVREIIHGSYRIIYEIFSDREINYILRFWHGARGEPEIKSKKRFVQPVLWFCD
jgi:plasmid stabilization system protein ParE